MIPQHVFCSFEVDQNDKSCGCGMCIPIGSEWSELSNTEKLAKMIVLKAQLAAEANANKSKL